eukprot:TRINITY_DN8449_c0_g1_i2.p1 TRINITY_DN8449_c0_g1~~TRINITY_DN8449_c0_g1_i2.p1  ORF type:complete len:162 (-),score=27.36 TRINITY_DN8449_c0_g1_i2:90-575(-)
MSIVPSNPNSASWKTLAVPGYDHPYSHYGRRHWYYPHYPYYHSGLTIEEANAQREEMRRQDEERVAFYKELDHREMERVVKESQVKVLGQGSARWAEVADPDSMYLHALVEAEERLQTGWSGTTEEREQQTHPHHHWGCLLYTSDAADEEDSVDLGGRRLI